ncbi:MAG: DUF5689 domain-containing protein [Paludibacteraceae bacterium]|nr:DUF5689 domain-containing protein [Paludibacteraceae bacterium]
MKTIKNISHIVLLSAILLLVACEPKGITEQDVFASEESLAQILDKENPYGYKIFNLEEFLDTFMTEAGNYASDTCPYRERSYDAKHGIYLYSVDTLPSRGRGIYIRGRVTTDDYAGNFYKSMVIQQVTDWHTNAPIEQQNLRISVDLGSSHGLYQTGQEILIRCNGLAVGRYANQPQLCVPSYNNNIFAMNASQKVGWAPGRIPSAVFRRNTRMIGAPDQSKLVYDEIDLVTLYSQIPAKPTLDAAGMNTIRKADGRLVIIKDVFFTGQTDDNGTIKDCIYAHPDSSSIANVFAPSTQNIGYPQSRILKDQAGKTICCSNSEYSKFATYYMPGADSTGVTNCKDYEGKVRGILGWYLDKAATLADNKLTGNEWSVTPRGIKGIGMDDIQMYYQGDTDYPWIPKEFDPKTYHQPTEN